MTKTTGTVLTDLEKSVFLKKLKYSIPNFEPKNNIEHMIYDISNNIVQSSYTDISNIFHVSHNNPFNYKNQICVDYIIKCINNAPIIPINKGNYLYFYLTDLKTDIPDTLAIKVGFTSAFLPRENSICSTLGCELLYLGYREIEGEYTEQEIHNLLKQRFNLLYHPIYENNKKLSREIYIFHPIVMNTAILYNHDNMKISYNIELEKTKQVVEIEKTKQEQEKTKQSKLQLKILQLQLNLKK